MKVKKINGSKNLYVVYKKKINIFISKLEKIYNKKIEVHYFERKTFYKNQRDPLVKSVLKDGSRIL